MERIQSLIDRLVEQKKENESPARMLVTVQLLQSELIQCMQDNASSGRSAVAIMMPARSAAAQHPVTEIAAEPPKPEQPPVIKEKPGIVTPAPTPRKEEPAVAVPAAHQPFLPPVEKKDATKTPAPVAEKTYATAFDIVAETPTLLQQLPRKEVNEAIAEKKESLNDRLKEAKIEVAHVLKEAPVKDLRKAIGINDKFLFVNELFRGDEGMYDRSIKTINNFQILPEAEYWMNRELKVKLGWNDSKELVQHFYQLVRRRFS